MPTAQENMMMARLRKELMDITMQQQNLGFSAFPSGDSLLAWNAIIQGPQDCVYEGLSFRLKIDFPSDYPLRPPKVKFLTPIFHPNVSGKGEICLDILKGSWSSIMTIENVLLSLRSLLPAPNVKDPFNIQAADLWVKNKEEFRAHMMEIYRDPMEIEVQPNC